MESMVNQMDLPTKILTGSYNQRKALFEALEKSLVNNEISENDAIEISKIIPLTLPRYLENSSRYLVLSFVSHLSQKYPSSVFKQLTTSLLKIFTSSSIPGRVKMSLFALKLSLILCKENFISCNEDWKEMILLHSRIFSAILGFSNESKFKIVSSSKRSIFQYWKSLSEFQISSLLELFSSVSDSQLTVLISVYCEMESCSSLNSSLRAHSLQILVNEFISGKNKSLRPYILNSIGSLFKKVTHEDFKTLLLPSFTKALLRNPEIVMRFIGNFLRHLSLDLSAYASELIKALLPHLRRNDEGVKEDALFTISTFASSSSDPSAISEFLSRLFTIYFEGFDGKTSLPAHKIYLIKAAGSLSNHSVLGKASFSLLNTAIDYFIKVLISENHEGTLLLTLEMLSKWTSSYLKGPPPNSLLSLISEKISHQSSSSSSSLKLSYLLLLSSLELSSTNSFKEPLKESLVKSLRAGSVSSNSIVLSEALLSALNVLQGDFDVNEIDILSLFKNPSLIEKLNSFLFGGNAYAEPLLILSERILLSDSLTEEDKIPWIRVLVSALLSSESKLRLSSFESLIRLTGRLRDNPSLLQNIIIQVNYKLESSFHSSDSILFFSSKSLIPLNISESPKILISLLLPSSALRLSSPWEKYVQYHGVSTCDLLSSQSENIVEYLKDNLNEFPVLVGQTTLFLSRLYPKFFIAPILTFLLKTTDPRSVTTKDMKIHGTEEGTLYDVSVFDNVEFESFEKQKIRNLPIKMIKGGTKESLYENADEENKSRKTKENQIESHLKNGSPKIKEAFALQLSHESSVRSYVQRLIDSNIPFNTLLFPLIQGSKTAFTTHTPKVLPILISALSSPLLAQTAKNCICSLSEILFKEDYGLSFSLRLTNFLISSSQDSNFKNYEFLQNLTLEILDKSEPEPFSTPRFFFLFQILRLSLPMFLSEKSSGEYLVRVFELLGREASQFRLHFPNNENDSESDDHDDDHDYDSLRNPKYLPRLAMLQFLLCSISSTFGLTQESAVEALLTVCSSASKEKGAFKISDEEIEVLLESLTSSNKILRNASLRALNVLYFPFGSSIAHRLYVGQFDEDEENVKLATQLWSNSMNKSGLETYPQLLNDVLNDVRNAVYSIQISASKALASLLSSSSFFSESKESALFSLIDFYTSDVAFEDSKENFLGARGPSNSLVDRWECRLGTARALKEIVPLLDGPLVKTLVSFFVSKGLGDSQQVVRQGMQDAALFTIEIHGKAFSSDLLPVFEEFLNTAPSSEVYDRVRESVVLLLGSCAKHLESGDPKIRPILRILILALNTPSQGVQEAVANCLPPLVSTIKDDAPSLLTNLLETLLDSEIGYGERKGSAYGIAGIVKGLGILSLKQYEIMSKLQNAITNKKNPKHREGALFAFESLTNMLGRLFEPYIVHILPNLLLCFGDSVEYVRLAADDTAKAVMSKLSAHGVKLVLPALLQALEQEQWRTKTGSVELLGAMAYCAPKQLSSCLPSIVPKLIEVLGDSHHKVQEAGAQALKQIGSVIRNPEIQSIVKILLRALRNPSEKTGPCLLTLLNTQFVHFIDAPSLALILPVVTRAFQDRSTETRKMAAQIIGNMYSLTDQKDLSPYLPGIFPGLKASLLDPVPEVRTVSAKALGAMMKGMGESSFEELLPWLMETLTSESSSVDRSGAAQGLSEVVGALGSEKMRALMPDIIKTTKRGDIAPHVKDGYIMMFIYMPLVFPEEFREYLSQIINPILLALADENEYVRDTAYKAGQRIVLTYGTTAMELLLPELEKGLFEENWRIRVSSVQLLGDLLFKISGVSGKMTTETGSEDDNFGTESSQQIIIKILGIERRNRVLSGLYMGRSDVALMVRQVSLHVWKVIVSNTPRTLREILPTLFNLLLGSLSSSSYDKRQIAAKTLGDIVKKLGERVLPEIIPILEKGLEYPEKRQGVCVGLCEIMAYTSKDMVLTFVDSLVPTLTKALTDESLEVRVSAAKTFETLHNTIGARALDDIVPFLLRYYKKGGEDGIKSSINTLDGLKQIMLIKPRALLPYILPKLLSEPVQLEALSILAPAAGCSALVRHISRILPALYSTLTASYGTPSHETYVTYASTIICSLHEESDREESAGTSVVLEELLSSLNSSESLDYKRSSVILLHAFIRFSKMNSPSSSLVSSLLSSLLKLFALRDERILNEANSTLVSLNKSLDSCSFMSHVNDIRQGLRFLLSDFPKETPSALPGFCLPKVGLSPILPYFREALLNGTPELKEAGASGLGEVISLTSPESLQPSVVSITGPLIRILGDRYNDSVKTAVLNTLSILLLKSGLSLKPFFPQLQTTILKALSDSHRSVRLFGGQTLSLLLFLHPKPEPLIGELMNGIKSSDEYRDTYFQALRNCLSGYKSRNNSLGEIDGFVISSNPFISFLSSSSSSLLHLLLPFLSYSESDRTRSLGSGCLGALLPFLSKGVFDTLILDVLLRIDENAHWISIHGRSSALSVLLKESPQCLLKDTVETFSSTLSLIQRLLTSDRVPLVSNGIRALTYVIAFHLKNKNVYNESEKEEERKKNERQEEDEEEEDRKDRFYSSSLLGLYVKGLSHGSNDVKELVANSVIYLGNRFELPPLLLKPLLPALVNGTKEKNPLVKSSCESALIVICKLNHRKYEKCLSQNTIEVLEEGGARKSLLDTLLKLQVKVSKISSNDDVVNEENIDDTLLLL